MTDHKPFTAEQLDGYAAQVESKRGQAVLTIRAQDARRLIAQAREEIRLRENAPVIAEIKELRFAYIRGEKLWRELLACVDRLVEPTEDPAARAKRELGEWLAENYEARKARLQRHNGMFRIHLHDSGYFNSSGPWFASEHEAITAALRAAKEKP